MSDYWIISGSSYKDSLWASFPWKTSNLTTFWKDATFEQLAFLSMADREEERTETGGAKMPKKSRILIMLHSLNQIGSGKLGPES